MIQIQGSETKSVLSHFEKNTHKLNYQPLFMELSIFNIAVTAFTILIATMTMNRFLLILTVAYIKSGLGLFVVCPKRKLTKPYLGTDNR